MENRCFQSYKSEDETLKKRGMLFTWIQKDHVSYARKFQIASRLLLRRLLSGTVEIPIDYPIIPISLLQPLIRLFEMTTVILNHSNQYNCQENFN